MTIPFLDDPLDDFIPEKPEFEPEIDPDFDDSLCPVCNIQLDQHSLHEIVDCALFEVKGGK